MRRWADTDDEEFEPGDRDGDEPTVPCPYCGREMLEDSPRCPYCGNYISREDHPPSRKPWWIILGGLAVLYIAYHWLTH
jgi:hypothetical protein